MKSVLPGHDSKARVDKCPQQAGDDLPTVDLSGSWSTEVTMHVNDEPHWMWLQRQTNVCHWATEAKATTGLCKHPWWCCQPQTWQVDHSSLGNQKHAGKPTGAAAASMSTFCPELVGAPRSAASKIFMVRSKLPHFLDTQPSWGALGLCCNPEELEILMVSWWAKPAFEITPRDSCVWAVSLRRGGGQKKRVRRHSAFWG